jgi:hypothetical protein
MRISRRHFTLGVTSATLGVATASWAQSFQLITSPAFMSATPGP